MKLFLGVMAVLVWLQTADSAPHPRGQQDYGTYGKATVQDLLKQLQKAKLAKTQQDQDAYEEDYAYNEDYYGNKEETVQDLLEQLQRTRQAQKQQVAYYEGDDDAHYEGYGDYHSTRANEQQDYSSNNNGLQSDLDAAIEGWWDSITNFGKNAWQGAKTGCKYVNGDPSSGGTGGTTGRKGARGGGRKGGAGTESYLNAGWNMLKNACNYVNKGPATTEGWFGITLKSLKNKAMQVMNKAKEGCKAYKTNPGMKKGLKQLAGSNARYLDMLCGGLNAGSNGKGRGIAIQMILKHTVTELQQEIQQTKMEERLGKALVQTFAN